MYLIILRGRSMTAVLNTGLALFSQVTERIQMIKGIE